MAEGHLDRRFVILAMGTAQILGWGTSFYFPAVLAEPIASETGWPLEWVVSGISIGLLVAGLISPRVGGMIVRLSGRSVLAISSLLFATGLGIIGLAPALAVYLLGWVVVGMAMGCGLYDAAFAALAQLYKQQARAPITSLTLFGGFASTICWPLSAYLVREFGWRETCFVYAMLHLFLALPLHLLVPRMNSESPVEAVARDGLDQGGPPRSEWLLFLLIASVMALAAGIGSIVVVHLLIFLQARGVDFAAAVALGTLFGPAQVGARVVERLFGHRYHPIWTMFAACVLMAVGLYMISTGSSAPFAAVLLYGAGYGITWVARGTLPLALFGSQRYTRLAGRLAFPSLIVQALAPSGGALLIDRGGALITMAVLTAIAAINVLLVFVLWLVIRNDRTP